MKYLDYVLIAWTYIKKRFVESLIITLGMALGIGSIASGLAILEFFNKQIFNEEKNKPYYREIYVGQFASSDRKPIRKIAIKEVEFAFSDLADIKEECPEIKYSYLKFYDDRQVEGVSDDKNEFVYYSDTVFSAFGVTNDFFPAYRIKLKEGSFFTPNDIEQGLPLVILGSNVAQRLFNNESALDHYVKLDGITHKVIGVSEYQDNVYANELWGINNVGFIPYTAARSYQRNPKIRELVFTATDINHLDAARRQLQTYFNFHYNSEEIRINSGSSVFRQYERNLITILMVIIFFAGTVLLIAAVNILNLMIARTVRRMRDIGISKAIGASWREIFLLYFTESLLLGIGGMVFGIGAYYGLMRILKVREDGRDLIPNVGPLGFSILIVLMLIIIFGIYPAYQGAKTEAAEAVRN